MLFLWLVFAIAANRTAAYAMPGAYERIYLWHAYQIDIKLHNGKPESFAKGCPNWAGLAAGVNCDFDQLINYMNSGRRNFSTRENARTNIDTWAQELFRTGNTAPYTANRFIEGSGTDVGELWRNTADKIVTWSHKVENWPDDVKRDLVVLRTCAKRMHIERHMATSEALRGEFDKSSPKFSYVIFKEKVNPNDPSPAHPYRDIMYKSHNRKAAVAAGWSAEDFDQKWNDAQDDGHKRMRNNAKAAVGLIHAALERLKVDNYQICRA